MKTTSLVRAIVLVLTVTSTALHAQVPQILNYQGRVAVGDPPVNFDGSGAFKFALVDPAGVNIAETATATPTIIGGFGDGMGQRVTAITVTSPGSGYVTAPAVTITDLTGPGSGATATAVIDGSGGVTSITVNANGTQYSLNTVVTLEAPPENLQTSTLWSNDGTSTMGSEPTAAVTLPVTKGLYSVLLGANMTPIPNSVFANPDVRLRVWFDDGTANGSQLLSPDQRIAAVGYAMMAAEALTVPDGAITSAKIAAGAITGAQLASNLTLPGTTTGTFSGVGSGLTNLPASALTGTITGAQLASNLTLPGTTTGTFTGNFTGTFSGDGSGLTNLPTSALTGMIPASQVATPPPGMVLIPAGEFTMGNTVAADTDITNAAPMSTTVSAFYMDVTEVTLSQWQVVQQWATLVGGYTGLAAGSGKGANHPVQTVTWYDCVKWCNARSEREGKTPVYYTDDAQTAVYRTGNADVTNVQVKWTANGYRLPTEAEWEKAARGGLSGKRFPWGDTISEKQANYVGSIAYAYDQGPNGYNAIGSIGGTSPATSPVGSFVANGYGLHDMAGNVYEWCWDWFGPYAGGTDPHGAAMGSGRVLRGGYGGAIALAARCAYRGAGSPVGVDYYLGFRAVLPPGQ